MKKHKIRNWKELMRQDQANTFPEGNLRRKSSERLVSPNTKSDANWTLAPEYWAAISAFWARKLLGYEYSVWKVSIVSALSGWDRITVDIFYTYAGRRVRHARLQQFLVGKVEKWRCTATTRLAVNATFFSGWNCAFLFSDLFVCRIAQMFR